MIWGLGVQESLLYGGIIIIILLHSIKLTSNELPLYLRISTALNIKKHLLQHMAVNTETHSWSKYREYDSVEGNIYTILSPSKAQDHIAEKRVRM